MPVESCHNYSDTTRRNTCHLAVTLCKVQPPSCPCGEQRLIPVTYLRVRAPFLAIQFACFVPGASPRTATLSTSRVLSRHDRLIRRPSCRFRRSGPALVCNGSTKGATAGHRIYLSFRSHHLVRPYRTAGIIRGFNE